MSWKTTTSGRQYVCCDFCGRECTRPSIVLRDLGDGISFEHYHPGCWQRMEDSSILPGHLTLPNVDPPDDPDARLEAAFTPAAAAALQDPVWHPAPGRRFDYPDMESARAAREEQDDAD